MRENKEMTEREAIAFFLHHLGNLVNAARALRLLRRDQPQWTGIVQNLEMMRVLAERLMHSTKGQVTAKSHNRSGLILPWRN